MIKEVFLNLDRCTDKHINMCKKFPKAIRISAIEGATQTPESILPYKADLTWRDPHKGRRLTEGEVGCTLSHIKAWKLCCLLEESIIVLEDDVEVLNVNYQQMVQKYSEYDFLYLGYKDMEGDCEKINEELKLPKFTYWTCGYYITPKVAQSLLDYFLTNPIIPADEVIPAILNIQKNTSLNQGHKFKIASFTNPLVQPIAGSFDNSDTEQSSTWSEFDFKIISCGTDETKMSKNIYLFATSKNENATCVKSLDVKFLIPPRRMSIFQYPMSNIRYWVFNFVKENFNISISNVNACGRCWILDVEFLFLILRSQHLIIQYPIPRQK